MKTSVLRLVRAEGRLVSGNLVKGDDGLWRVEATRKPKAKPDAFDIHTLPKPKKA